MSILFNYTIGLLPVSTVFNRKMLSQNMIGDTPEISAALAFAALIGNGAAFTLVGLLNGAYDPLERDGFISEHLLNF